MGANLSTAIATVAKHRPGSLGVIRRGRSRIWLDDHGWWLAVVEFQPSMRGRFYVNIGEDHLFVRRDHVVLEDMERPLGGVWTGDHSNEVITGAVEAAADAIIARRVRHGRGRSALARLLDSDDLTAGIAAALLGEHSTARARLKGQVHPAYRPVADEYLAALDDGAVEALARTVTNETRAALRLPPAHQLWGT